MSNSENRYLVSEMLPGISETLDVLREEVRALNFEGASGEYTHGSDYECALDSLYDRAKDTVRSYVWYATDRGASAVGIRATIRLACHKTGWEPGWLLSLAE